MRNTSRTLLPLLALLLLLAACVPITPAETTSAEPEMPRLNVFTMGNVIANHIYNIAGNHVTINRLVAQGTDPHHFEPTPGDITKLTEADIVFIRGATQPQLIRARIGAIVGDVNKVVLLAESIDPAEYILDDHGAIDLHLGGDPGFVLEFVAVIRDTMVERDPANADDYQANYEQYTARIQELDAAIHAVTASIPEENRQLLSYHNSFGYFARRYGYTILGSIQPHDFSEPSAHDVAEIIDLLREKELPAIFGSSFTPSSVMDQISRESGVPIVMLNDDDLPGVPGDLEHSYINMRVQNMTLIAGALGGDPSLLEGIETRNVPDIE